MTTAAFDVIVLGCGGFGSAACSHLARRGLRVLGIDRHTPPHALGSSHGDTRIIRIAYFEHPDYVPLLLRAYQLWDELSERTAETRTPADRELLIRCGLLMAGQPEGDVITGARTSAHQHGLTLESLTGDDLRRRFPTLRIPANLEAVFEPEAGYLWAERCVSAHLADAAQHGARFCFDEPVTSVQLHSGSATVQTVRQTFSASCVVTCAGSWTRQLLPEYTSWIRIVRKVLFWHPVTSSVWSDAGSPAFFVDDADSGRQFYGFPSLDGQHVKLAEHTGGQPVDDPSQVNRSVAPGEDTDVGRFAVRYLNGVSPAAVRSAVCMYSMSPDGHFLLDRLTDRPAVVAAGFSGHGFKFTSVLGEAIADLVIDGKSSLPIGFLSSARLTDATGLTSA